jgi:hypothetical protein
MAHGAEQDSSRLSPVARALLALLFGACASILIQALAASGEASRFQVLLMATSLSALLTSLLWIALLAAQRSRAWALAIYLGIWIPYVNLLIAALFARRYWSQGARRPALLGLAALVCQLAVSLQMLLCVPPAPL